MKKIVFTVTVIVFAFLANVSAQLKVNSTGQVGIGTTNPQYKLHVVGDTYVTGNIYLGSTTNFLGTTSNTPITFKVNNMFAGSTGSNGTNSVSFGYGSKLGGYSNTAIGAFTLYEAQSCAHNTAVGNEALYHNTEGDYNTAIGEYALRSNNYGIYNTAIGYNALQGHTNGYNNTAIGAEAGITGSYMYNATAVGSGAIANANNQVRIGNSSVTSIGGYAAWTNFSDKRAKKNIRADVPGLAFINRLQPITYNLDLDAIDGLLKIDKTGKSAGDDFNRPLSQELINLNKKAREAKEKVIQTGFIAQDVEEIAKSVGYDFSGVDVDETGIYGLRYAEFVVPLVKAVQELSEQNKRMQAQINELLQEKSMSLRSGNAGELTTGLQDLTISGASLQQNAPNPFSQNTQIKFYLPQNIKTAFLNIYNLQGKQLKQIVVTQRGESVINISGSEFPVGIYLYALIADGQKVDIRQMILTE